MKAQKTTNKHHFSLFTVIFSMLPLFFLLGCTRLQSAKVEESAVEAVAVECSAEEPIAEAGLEYIYASVYNEENQPSYESLTVILEVPVSEPRFAVIPPNARPGEPVTVGYGYNFTGDYREFHAVLLDSRGRRLTRAVFFNMDLQDGEQTIKAAIMAVPSTALIGDALIRIESGDDIIREIPFTIDSREFHSETIALNQANTDLRTLPDPQRTAESQRLWAIINRTGTEIFDTGPFERPVT